MVVGIGVLFSRRSPYLSWFALVAVLICYALLVFSAMANWDETLKMAASRHVAKANEAATNGSFKAFTMLFGWIPAAIYCGFWYAFFEFRVLRKLRFKPTGK